MKLNNQKKQFKKKKKLKKKRKWQWARARERTLIMYLWPRKHQKTTFSAQEIWGLCYKQIGRLDCKSANISFALNTIVVQSKYQYLTAYKNTVF